MPQLRAWKSRTDVISTNDFTISIFYLLRYTLNTKHKRLSYLRKNLQASCGKSP